MIDKNTFARLVLCNDFSGTSVLTNEEFYSLERLWQDGEELNAEDFLGGEEK